MTNAQLGQLIEEIDIALAKGHLGFTIRGEQMNAVAQALLHFITDGGTPNENGAAPHGEDGARRRNFTPIEAS